MTTQANVNHVCKEKLVVQPALPHTLHILSWFGPNPPLCAKLRVFFLRCLSESPPVHPCGKYGAFKTFYHSTSLFLQSREEPPQVAPLFTAGPERGLLENAFSFKECRLIIM